MSEYEAALVRLRARGRRGGRKPKMTPDLINKAQRMDDARPVTMAEIAAFYHVIPMRSTATSAR